MLRVHRSYTSNMEKLKDHINASVSSKYRVKSESIKNNDNDILN